MPPAKTIAVVGPSGTGKTTLLHKLRLGDLKSQQLPGGFTIEQLQYKNLTFQSWSFGPDCDAHRTATAPLLQKAAAVMFVADASGDDQAIAGAIGALRVVLGSTRADAPLLIYGNKQDRVAEGCTGLLQQQAGACNFGERPWSLQALGSLDARTMEVEVEYDDQDPVALSVCPDATLHDMLVDALDAVGAGYAPHECGVTVDGEVVTTGGVDGLDGALGEVGVFPGARVRVRPTRRAVSQRWLLANRCDGGVREMARAVRVGDWAAGGMILAAGRIGVDELQREGWGWLEACASRDTGVLEGVAMLVDAGIPPVMPKGSLLVHAVKHGQAALVDLLLRAYQVDPNHSAAGTIPLAAAVVNEHTTDAAAAPPHDVAARITALLLDAGADPNYHAPCGCVLTQVILGDPTGAATDALLRAGARPDCEVDTRGHGVCQTPLAAAASKGARWCRAVLDAGCTQVNTLTAGGTGPLTHAVTPEVARMLLDAGGDVCVGLPIHKAVQDAQRGGGLLDVLLSADGAGRALAMRESRMHATPLHLVKSVDIARRLLRTPAADALNTVNANAMTPLAVAIKTNHVELARLYVAAGARAEEALGAEGWHRTAYRWVDWREHAADAEALARVVHEAGGDAQRGLLHAVTRADARAVDVMLRLCGDAPVHEHTLRAAVDMQLTVLVAALLRHGTQPATDDGRIGLPLHWAAHVGAANITAALLRQSSVNTPNERDRRTPLHFAARTGSLPTVQVLLQHGADPRAVDDEGRVPAALVPTGLACRERDELLDALRV